jgi:hypothetical protein
MPTWSLGLILQVNEVLSASPLMGSPSDDHYLDWVRQNVFTNPSLMEINNKKMNAVRQNWARKNQAEQERKLVAWVERLWIKWLQSHMKYLRRLKDSRQQPTHSTPAPVDKNPSPTSPLPNIRQLFHPPSPKFTPINRSLASPEFEVLQQTRPSETAKNVIHMLFNNHEIPSYDAFLQYMLHDFPIERKKMTICPVELSYPFRTERGMEEPMEEIEITHDQNKVQRIKKKLLISYSR